MLAQELRLSGKIDESIAALLSVLEIAPNHAAAHHNLGFLYERKSQNKKACSEYKEAIRLDPSIALAYVNLGALLLEEERFEEATTILRQGLTLFPQDAMLHYNLGKVYDNTKQRELAVSEYQAAIHYDPKFTNAYVNLGRNLVLSEDWPAVIDAYQRALELGSDAPALKRDIGSAWIQLKRTDKAISQFIEIIRSSPEDSEAHAYLSRAYIIHAIRNRSRESVRLAEGAVKQALHLKPYSLLAVLTWFEVMKLKRSLHRF